MREELQYVKAQLESVYPARLYKPSTANANFEGRLTSNVGPIV
jgi:hypothetical protein